MQTTARLSCSHANESAKTLQFSGRGRYEIRITRTTAMTEHVEGNISLKSSSGQKLLKRVYRSDKGGFRSFVTISNDETHELNVTGTAHSFASGLFGCGPSGIIVTISPEATFDERLGTRDTRLSSELSFSLMETCESFEAEYPDKLQAGIQEARSRSQADLFDYMRHIYSDNFDALCNTTASWNSGSSHFDTVCDTLMSGNAAFEDTSEEYLIDFIATSLSELVELLEQNLASAGIEVVQSERMLITDVTGVVVVDWPESEENFPLHVRYTRFGAPLALEEHMIRPEYEQVIQNFHGKSQGSVEVSMKASLRHFMRSCGLRTHDMGVRNVDERGKYIYNQCFYLSLSRGLLGQTATQMQVRTVALKLKRTIEAAVIAERPHWRKEVGEEAQAFADFLPIAMRASSQNNFLSQLAVCIMDSSRGHAEMFLGPLYKRLRDPQVQHRNLVILWYAPGHYKCVVNDDRSDSKVMITYSDFRCLLKSRDVKFIETLA